MKNFVEWLKTKHPRYLTEQQDEQNSQDNLGYRPDEIIIQKNADYHKNSNTQKIVQDFISNMYENKKEEAIKISKNISRNIEKEGF